MIQRIVVYSLLVLSLGSCEFFNKKTNTYEKSIDTIIDYSSVDQLVLFQECESLLEVDAQEQCSIAYLSELLLENLSQVAIYSTSEVNETIYLTIQIDNEGLASLVSVEINDVVEDQIQDIQSILQQGVDELPAMQPALKKGIPVTVQFTIPVNLN